MILRAASNKKISEKKNSMYKRVLYFVEFMSSNGFSTAKITLEKMTVIIMNN